MVKVLYVFFTGLLLAVFIGVGIAAFYAGPDMPEYPNKLEYRETPAVETAEDRQLRMDYDAQYEQYQEELGVYSRNVSLIALGAALLYMVAGILLAEKFSVIGDGFLLGGLFTLFYSVIMGFQTEDNRFRFILVTVGLIVALTLGYLKFVKVDKK